MLFALAALLSCYGCITGNSGESGKLITTAELDSHQNSKKLDQLGENISDLKDTIDGFQTDVRYLREEIDHLKERVEEMDRGAKPGVKKEKFQEGDIVPTPPHAIEEVREMNKDVPAEPISPSNNLQVTSLKSQDFYQNAYDDLRFGEYKSAIENFTKFIDQYPNDKLANNAQYWIGECYYGMKDFKRAAEEFKKVQENYPHGAKVPDAKLKYALCLYDLKEIDLCFAELKKLVSEYKGTRIGEAASKQIERLKNKLKP